MYSDADSLVWQLFSRPIASQRVCMCIAPSTPQHNPLLDETTIAWTDGGWWFRACTDVGSKHITTDGVDGSKHGLMGLMVQSMD